MYKSKYHILSDLRTVLWSLNSEKREYRTVLRKSKIGGKPRIINLLQSFILGQWGKYWYEPWEGVVECCPHFFNIGCEQNGSHTNILNQVLVNGQQTTH